MCKKSYYDRKRSNMLSTKYRNHQYVDGKAYHETFYSESLIYETSYSGMMQSSKTHFYVHLTYAPIQDRISMTNRQALQELCMTLTMQQEMYSAREEEVQITDNYVEVETISTEPESKPKSNKRKWLFGLGASTVLAGMITYVFKNK